MLCKKLGVQFTVVSYDRNLWSQTLVCVFFFYLKECTIAACNFSSRLANSFHSREIKVPGFDTCCWKSVFFLLRKADLGCTRCAHGSISGLLTYFVASLSRSRVPVRHWEPQSFSKGKRELFLEIFKHVARQGSKCSSLWCLWGYFGNGSKKQAAPSCLAWSLWSPWLVAGCGVGACACLWVLGPGHLVKMSALIRVTRVGRAPWELKELSPPYSVP